MSHSDESSSNTNMSQKKYIGVRRRKWGKWVSEIRVPGTQDRLWLGTYVSAEAAAVAHDIAYYCLKESFSVDKLNLPLLLPASTRKGMSPRSVQKVATDAGMAIDAQLLSGHRIEDIVKMNEDGVNLNTETSWLNLDNGQPLNITIDDYLSRAS